MGKRIVLHVGAMKSGTSYLQTLLMDNKARLAEHGVVVPGERWGDQVVGVAEVLERRRVMRGSPGTGAWQSLVDEVLAHDGTSVISMEFFGPVGLPKIEKVRDSFGDVRVEAVVTARDLGRNIPAMWQEFVKNGGTTSLEDYVEKVRKREDEGSRFWREQSIGAIARRWSDVLGVDAVTVVTVPGPGVPGEELWNRFSTTLSVDPTVVEQPPRSNESLGAASVEVVRRLNASLSDLSFGQYAPVVKHRLAKKTLGGRRGDEPAIGFDVPAWVGPSAERMIANIEKLGVAVVGDLQELRPVSTPGVAPGAVSAEEQLAAATAGMEGLVRALVSLRERQGAS
ncbi:hypothetical protein [Nocardioides jishulii]|uniref:Sulfotransferase family protein n=1 Tax=Nocardioides jishulii TaxID=2575440 RepID=A0A4U2YK99_9ACTN|nr:hypothetical protein [Nocardioides jishulii]QCX28178.1 hypothetical protein FCL41_12110 [Nocardioides jishulii]TKI60842.1 hypothetical protein FC770_15180 [Nocardioides jishulii]